MMRFGLAVRAATLLVALSWFFSIATAQTVLPLPADLAMPGGSVQAIALQGDGKVLVGGDIGKIGGAPRRNLARLNADGSVDATFHVDVDNTVLAIAVSGSTAYISGMFSHVGTQQRFGVAAIDLDTGEVLPWNPGAAPAYISALAVGNGAVYIGGYFGTMGGASRTGLAAVDAVTGVALPFDAQMASGQVTALAIDDGIVYAGGFFGLVGGIPHNGLVAFDATTGAADAWAPFAADEYCLVRDIAIVGSTLYTSGNQFRTQTGGFSALAAFDLTSHTRLAWEAPYFADTFHIAAEGSSMYVAGQFFNAGASSIGFAKIRLTDASLEPWDADVDADLGIAVATDGSHVYIGGQFTHAQGVETGGFARVDSDTAALADSPPIEAVSELGALAYQDDGKIVIGGYFARVDGIPRKNIARLLADGSVDPDFDPGANGYVWGLLVHDSTIYASGNFSQLGGLPRKALGAIDANTGATTAWNPTIGQSGPGLPYIGSLVASDTTLYAAGLFSTLGNQARANLAAVDLASGSILPWAPGTDDQVTALTMANGSVFAGGFFSTAGGQPREHLAAFDATTGSLLAWNPGANDTVFALAAHGDSVFAGGEFTLLGGQPRSALAEIDATTGGVSDWAPIADASVHALDVGEDRLFAGGAFSTIDGEPRASIAAFDVSTHALTPWSVAVDGLVHQIAVGSGAVAFGGSFMHAGGEFHDGVAVATLVIDYLFGDGFDGASPLAPPH
jgi:hypothetical protein